MTSRQRGGAGGDADEAPGTTLSIDDRVLLELARGSSRARDIAWLVRCAERTARRILAGNMCRKYSGRGDWTLSSDGYRRVHELTDPLRSSDPTLSLRDACGLLLGRAPEPKPEPKLEIVWNLSWRCSSCGSGGRAADDGDPAAPLCPCCGSGDLTFAPLQH